MRTPLAAARVAPARVAPPGAVPEVGQQGAARLPAVRPAQRPAPDTGATVAAASRDAQTVARSVARAVARPLSLAGVAAHRVRVPSPAAARAAARDGSRADTPPSPSASRAGADASCTAAPHATVSRAAEPRAAARRPAP